MSEPALRSAAPTFAVSDVAATMTWYETVLGFKADTFPDDKPYAWASLRRDGIEIMLLHVEDYRRPDIAARRPEGYWDAYIRMAGVREYYEQVRARAPIRLPLVKQGYGDWEFEIVDPNGYILVFSEWIDEAPPA